MNYKFVRNDSDISYQSDLIKTSSFVDEHPESLALRQIRIGFPLYRNSWVINLSSS